MSEENIFTNVMVDLETLGNGPDAAIASIGACCFDMLTGEIGATFYRVVDIETSTDFGGKIDAGTVAWWMKQSEEARAVFQDPRAMMIGRALMDFSAFLKRINKPKIWGNGSGFDNVILRQSYKRMQLPVPFDHWNDRDVRTIVDLGRSILGIDPKKTLPREGVFHNALDDAIHQARYVSQIYAALNEKAPA